MAAKITRNWKKRAAKDIRQGVGAYTALLLFLTICALAGIFAAGNGAPQLLDAQNQAMAAPVKLLAPRAVLTALMVNCIALLSIYLLNSGRFFLPLTLCVLACWAVCAGLECKLLMTAGWRGALLCVFAVLLPSIALLVCWLKLIRLCFAGAAYSVSLRPALIFWSLMTLLPVLLQVSWAPLLLGLLGV